MVELPHPLCVAFGQVVVDCDQMGAFAFEGVEIDRQGRDQGLALTCFHFGDPALVQDHSADELHVEMPHVELAAGHLPTDRESFRQNIVKGFAGSQALLEGLRFVGQGVIGQRSQLRFQGVDALDDWHQGLDFTVVLAAENEI